MTQLQSATVTTLADTKSWEWRQSPLPPLSDPHLMLASDELNGHWTTCTQSPSVIHVELLAAGKIEDPFLGMNEENCQWVGERDWLYRTSFQYNPDQSEAHIDLFFEGLDTFATVYLNSRQILSSDNMFRSYRVDITDHLSAGNNVLLIIFQSAFIKGRIEEEKRVGEGKHLACFNGDPSRLFVRKAQYHWSWDWGPKLMTAGPWKPIRLESYSVRLLDIWTQPIVSSDLSATLTISTPISSPLNSTFKIHITLFDPIGNTVRQSSVNGNGASAEGLGMRWEFTPGEFELWWSVGLGKQPLYTVRVELLSPSGTLLSTQTKKIGFRRLVVVQEPLVAEPGSSFYFEINNVPLFIGGSNWIPIDSFLTNGSEKRYRDWMEMLVRGNQNMVRVWGGGIYEDDAFYEACDELGILCWQDFMFGCGAYPAHPGFIESVKLEAEDNVKRIRHHPCLAIFAGNNEDYQVAEQMHLDYDPNDHSGDWSKTNFPARTIYERVLPEVMGRLAPEIYYHPGSPWGGKTSDDPTTGDLHQWNVWHGSQEPYQNWDKLGGRFVSEFGMQGLPNIQTIDYFLNGESSERFPQSKTVGYHNKADGYERRLELYLVENIRHGFSLEDYVYATQLIQAETLSTAYRLWRRNFKGPGKAYTAGALVWQLNDVYPCTSWSICDYFIRPKPAYYSIKQSMAPIAIGMRRYTERIFPDRHSVVNFQETTYVDMWAANSLLVPREVKVVVEAFELLSGLRIFEKTSDATLLSNRSTELDKVEVPIVPQKPDAAIVVTSKLVDVMTLEVLSRFSAFPEPYKFLTFPAPEKVQLAVDINVAKESIYLSTSHPIKGLILACNDDVTFSDNALDLIPCDSREIKVTGLTPKSKITWRYLGDSHVL